MVKITANKSRGVLELRVYGDKFMDTVETLRLNGAKYHAPTKSWNVNILSLDDIITELNFEGEVVEVSALTKKEVEEYQFDSVWEYAFYRYHKEVAGNVITRNETEWIPYFDETGKQRKFYFDFLVNAVPYEVKGFFRPSDMAKMQSTSGQVTFVSKPDILPIMKELDKQIPGWRSDCIFN